MTPPATAGIQDAARHLAEGRPADAVEMLDRIVRDFPTYVTAHVLLAKAREALDDEPEALAAWHAAYFLMPGSPLVVRERARLLRIAAFSGVSTPAPAPTPTERDERDEAQQRETQHESETGQDQPKREQAEATVGGEPSAWERDAQDVAAPEPSAMPARDAKATADWKIVEETEAERPASEGPVEPVVAPPVGHRSAQHAAHDVSRPSPFVDEELVDEELVDEELVDEELVDEELVDEELAGEDAEPDGAAANAAEVGSTEAEAFAAEDGDGATAVVDDLDALIQQLESAPRIRPDPEFNDDVPEPEVAEGELVSETLARIYEAQGQYDEAARAYEQLASKHPGRATELLSKAAAMRQKTGEAEG